MAAPNILTNLPADAYGYRAPRWVNRMENMPEENSSDYEHFHLYIIDGVARGAGVQDGDSAAAVQHETVCNLVYDTFSNHFMDCIVHSVRMKPGQREEDFVLYFAIELEKYTSRDLVVIFYHRKAGLDGEDYKWRFRGPGPKTINAHDLICQVNKARPDCYFILDCFFPTSFLENWTRKKGMTEFSVTGHQMHNEHGKPINGPENFTETFCRAVRDNANLPRGNSRQSIHHIIAKDKIKCSNPLHLFAAKPDRRKRNTVWRLYLDDEMVEETRRFKMRNCKVTGSRKGDGQFRVGHFGVGQFRDDTDDDDDEDGDRGNGHHGGGGGRGGDDDDGDSDSDSDSENGIGGGATNDPDARNDSDDQSVGAGSYADGNNGNREGDARPKSEGQTPQYPLSPVASSAKTAVKRSSSPFSDVGSHKRLESEDSVKRELSSSPELEIIGSRAIRAHIDLTWIGELIDLTQEDEGEESLFVPQ